MAYYYYYLPRSVLIFFRATQYGWWVGQLVGQLVGRLVSCRSNNDSWPYKKTIWIGADGQ